MNIVLWPVLNFSLIYLLIIAHLDTPTYALIAIIAVTAFMWGGVAERLAIHKIVSRIPPKIEPVDYDPEFDDKT